jgi:hypothetical protein
MRAIDILALEVSDEIIGDDGRTKLPLESWLESGRYRGALRE